MQEIKYAKVVRIGSRMSGIFTQEYSQKYKTKQIYFETNNGRCIRVNVSPMFKNSLLYQDLKVGDFIKGFRMQKGKNKDIIDPHSTFEKFHPNGLF